MIPRSRPLAIGWAVALPLAVAASLSLLRDVLANTSMALILVLVVVAVAVRGDRLAGAVSAVVAAASFDFFLTAPYFTFAIREPTDIETAVLLVVVGLAVTEVAQWARRELDRAGRREGYVAGLAKAARMAGDGSADLVGTVAHMIAEILDLDDCRFTPDAPQPARPRLTADGNVTWHGRVLDIEREGLPTMDVIELPARDGVGTFLLTASTGVRRPTREQLQVAVTLAGQVDAAAIRPPR